MKMFYKLNYAPINEIDKDKVNDIVNSILTNGWQGAPILYHEGIGLITGSHRAIALEKIAEMYDKEELSKEQRSIVEMIVYEEDYAKDVTSLVDKRLYELDKDIEFDNLGEIFEGTEIERWKEEILEWD